jgi:hypothetical protein
VARWDGAAWHALGGGMNGTVYALAEYDGQIVAGGAFTSADGAPAASIARWDGTGWRALGSGLAGSLTCPGCTFVYALAAYGGDLIAAGNFTSAGGVPANGLARWDGAAWSPLGDGVNNEARALAVHGGDLVVGGVFTMVGGVAAGRVARWDGSSLTPMGAGFNDTVSALSARPEGLLAGGAFTRADGAPATRIARWTGQIWAAYTDGVGANTTYSGSVSAFGDLGGDLLVGGNFTLAGGEPSAYLARWLRPCRADVDCDGAASVADFLAYLAAFAASEPRADFTGDGTVDVQDFLAFLSAF